MAFARWLATLVSAAIAYVKVFHCLAHHRYSTQGITDDKTLTTDEMQPPTFMVIGRSKIKAYQKAYQRPYLCCHILKYTRFDFEECCKMELSKASNTSGDIFLSYSHKDQEWLDRFLIMLRPYVQLNGISVWSDQEINSGSRWIERINSAIVRAKDAVLFISSDFFASSFIQETELPQLLTAEQQGRINLHWIAVRPSLYTETPIARFQALNNPLTPLSNVDTRLVEDELLKICYKLKLALAQRKQLGSGGMLTQVGINDNSPKIEAIRKKILELDKARIRRDLHIEKNDKEIDALINSSHEIEIIIFKLLATLNIDRLEAHLTYDVELLSTIEAISNLGSNPVSFGLPSFEDALLQFKNRRVLLDQSSKFQNSIFSSVEKLISEPIVNLGKNTEETINQLDSRKQHRFNTIPKIDKEIKKILDTCGTPIPWQAAEDLIQFYSMRAKLNEHLKNYSSAIKDYDTIINYEFTFPNPEPDSQWYIRRGELKKLIGDKRGSEDDFRKAQGQK